MKMSRNSQHDTYDGSKVAAFDADGRPLTYDDQEWERQRDFWDSQGVADELIAMAKPLLLGDWQQVQAASEVLQQAAGKYRLDDEDFDALSRVVKEQGSVAGDAGPGPSQEQVLAAWESESPHGGRHVPVLGSDAPF